MRLYLPEQDEKITKMSDRRVVVKLLMASEERQADFRQFTVKAKRFLALWTYEQGIQPRLSAGEGL